MFGWLIHYCVKYLTGFKISNAYIFVICLEEGKMRNWYGPIEHLSTIHYHITPAFPTIVTSSSLPWHILFSGETGEISKPTILQRLENRTSFCSMTPNPLVAFSSTFLCQEGVTFGFLFKTAKGNSRFSFFSAGSLALWQISAIVLKINMKLSSKSWSLSEALCEISFHLVFS